jgi:hypothetical protein
MVIDYNQPWQLLNFEIQDAIRHDVNLKKYEEKIKEINRPMGMWTFQQSRITEILNQNWLEQVKETYNIDIDFLAMFYRTPFYNHPEAHVDIGIEGDVCIGAINWVLDPNDDSTMDWYSTPLTDQKIMTTVTGTKYMTADMSHIKDFELCSRTIGNTATLVNVGIFHNITMKQKPRWAISVRPKLPEIKNWQEMVNFFKPWIKTS